jgi:translation initiation factor 2 subunit 1
MVVKKQGMPERDEFVICRIAKIYPNSVSAELVEYKKMGMIHVSEVASRWVRDIREFLKENQYVVCRVMRVEGDHIHLSVKRVGKEQATSKLNQFKRELKAEKMLELAAKNIKKTLEDAYREVGMLLQEEFGSVSKAFEIALKNPSLLKSKGVPADWAAALIETAQKNYVEKTYKVKANLSLISYDPKGIEIIRKALAKAQENHLAVTYVSSPHYVISGTGNNYKKLATTIEEVSEAIVRDVKKAGGDASFELED